MGIEVAELLDQISWLGVVLLAGLPGSWRNQWPYVAFVTLTVAGRRELCTPLPWNPATTWLQCLGLQATDGIATGFIGW